MLPQKGSLDPEPPKIISFDVSSYCSSLAFASLINLLTRLVGIFGLLIFGGLTVLGVIILVYGHEPWTSMMELMIGAVGGTGTFLLIDYLNTRLLKLSKAANALNLLLDDTARMKSTIGKYHRFDFDRPQAREEMEVAKDWKLAGQLLQTAVLALTGRSIGPNIFVSQTEKAEIRALQCASLSAADLTRKDDRPPVLYLRSFNDENIGFQQALLADGGNLEDVIRKTSTLLGPVIAIGKPGDKLPPLGAARDYVGDSEWQAHVEAWMEESQLIVLVIGSSSGVAWEANTVLRQKHLDKTIFVFPPVSLKHQTEIFTPFFSKLEPHLKFSQLVQVGDQGVVTALIEPAGDVGAFTTSERSSYSYECALQLAITYIIRRRQTNGVVLSEGSLAGDVDHSIIVQKNSWLFKGTTCGITLLFGQGIFIVLLWSIAHLKGLLIPPTALSHSSFYDQGASADSLSRGPATDPHALSPPTDKNGKPLSLGESQALALKELSELNKAPSSSGKVRSPPQTNSP